MSNHYHLLIEIGGDNLSKGMRQLNGVYTQYGNREHGRAGHLLQGRYKAILVEKDSHLLLGRIPYDAYRKVLQVSAAHVYLTYPFVLSWSMLEAMASGCLLIGSATPPVQEVIRHNENGLLVDFFDSSALADTLTQVLQQPHLYQTLRQTAQQQAQLLYSYKHGLAGYLRLIR